MSKVISSRISCDNLSPGTHLAVTNCVGANDDFAPDLPITIVFLLATTIVLTRPDMFQRMWVHSVIVCLLQELFELLELSSIYDSTDDSN